MSLLRRLRDTFRPDRIDTEIDQEFQFHFEQRVDDLIASGATPDEARREAARVFGNRAHLRESTRDRNVLPGLQAVLQDVRFAVRNMRRNPAFAAAAVLSLALGIGANTALFSVLDGLLLRLLPVADARSLVLLRDTTSDRFPYPAYELLRAIRACSQAWPVFNIFPELSKSRIMAAVCKPPCRPFPATIFKCSA